MSRADFLQLCRRFENNLKSAPEKALSQALEEVSKIDPQHRMPPPFWANRLVNGWLPVGALQLINGLRLFDLVVDEETLQLKSSELIAEAFEALERWVKDIPPDGKHGIESLDWSCAAWVAETGSAPLADFCDVNWEVVPAVLSSALCSGLKSLNLSKGVWIADDLGNHDSYLDNAQIMYCYMLELSWTHLIDQPWKQSLEQLFLAGTIPGRASELAYDVDYLTTVWDDYEEEETDYFSTAGAPFPKLRHLTLARGPSGSQNYLLRDLIAAGAMPALDTLDLSDDFSPRVKRELEDADDEYQTWLHHDYGAFLEGVEGRALMDVVLKAPSVPKKVAFGTALENAQAAFESLRKSLEEDLEDAETSNPSVIQKGIFDRTQFVQKLTLEDDGVIAW